MGHRTKLSVSLARLGDLTRQELAATTLVTDLYEIDSFVWDFHDVWVAELGEFTHESEGQMVCRVGIPEKVPYFNAGVYSSTKTRYGQVDEVFGPVNECVSVCLPCGYVDAILLNLSGADVYGQV